MTEPQAGGAHAPQARVAWTTAGANAALCVASLDAILAVLRDPRAVDSPLQLAPTAALLAAFVAVAFAVGAPFASLMFRQASRTRPACVATGLAVGLISAFSVAWIGDLTALSTFSEAPLEAAASIGLLAVVSVLSAAGAGLLAARLGDPIWILRRLSILGIGLACAAAVLAISAVSEPIGAAIAAPVALAALLVAFSVRAGGRRLQWIGVALVAATCVLGLAGASWRAGASRASAAQGAPAGAPRKVLLLTVDTLRRDAVGTYDASARTPHLDSLARDSVVFEQAFSSAPWTVPSFVSMFTGLSALTHGVNQNFAEIPAAYGTLAEAMRRGGYATAALGDQVQLQRMGRGFDRYQFERWQPAVHPATTAGKLLIRASQRRPWRDPDVTAAALDFIRSRRGEDFFLWVHWIAPHISYAPPAEFLEQTPRVGKFGSVFASEYASSVHAGRRLRTPEERAWLRELYAAEVRYVDSLLGRVLGELGELGLYDDALIVFASDHGEEFWEHGRWEHGHSLYDELVAVPFFVKPPGLAAGRRVAQPVTTASIAATILDLCGLPAPPDPRAAPSLRSLWESPQASGDAPPVFLGGVEYFEPRSGVVFDRFKYIASDVSPDQLLFDRSADPHERRSLVNAQPDAVARARGLIAAEHASAGPDEPAPEPDLSPEVEEQLRSLGYLE